VRRALADELTALDGMQTADVEGVTLTLASLARVVDDLPLRTLVGRAGTDEPVAAEGSGLDRAWSAVRNAMGSLVRHSKPGDAAIPLMTPDAEVFLRTNLKLQLQTARLALLRGERAAFTQSLDDAARWLREYFDPAETPVRSALETITEIRDAAAPGEKPDISESLRLLRQYRTLAETAQ
jgi:uroporphyrin-3 C-methyltransferase